MVVASTFLSSCLLLEPSPLYSSSKLCYDDYDEASHNIEYIYQEDLFCNDDFDCSVCSCEHYRRARYQLNSACVCGHSRDSHSIRMGMSSLPDDAQPTFEASVSYGNLIASYNVDPNKGELHAGQKKEVFINPFYISTDGGSYEFEYVNETFYISSVYDSSMPTVNSPFSTRLFKSVKSLSCNGPYYRISCNMGTHTWKIEVDPMPISCEHDTRSIYVLMWTPSHNYNLVFHFEQSNF